MGDMRSRTYLASFSCILFCKEPSPYPTLPQGSLEVRVLAELSDLLGLRLRSLCYGLYWWSSRDLHSSLGLVGNMFLSHSLD